MNNKHERAVCRDSREMQAGLHRLHPKVEIEVLRKKLIFWRWVSIGLVVWIAVLMWLVNDMRKAVNESAYGTQAGRGGGGGVQVRVRGEVEAERATLRRGDVSGFAALSDDFFGVAAEAQRAVRGEGAAVDPVGVMNLAGRSVAEGVPFRPRFLASRPAFDFPSAGSRAVGMDAKCTGAVVEGTAAAPTCGWKPQRNTEGHGVFTTDLPNREASCLTVRAVVLCDASPKGLGTTANKPLMRKRSHTLGVHGDGNTARTFSDFPTAGSRAGGRDAECTGAVVDGSMAAPILNSEQKTAKGAKGA